MPPVSYVLVVDDDHATVDFLCEALTDEGYIALSASDGPSALRLIAAQAPALLVVDLWMPEMSGVELIARLHDGGLACFPIVVISGSLVLQRHLSHREHRDHRGGSHAFPSLRPL